MKLTEKQKRFCDYYIASGNATESYRRVYKDCKKDETVRANASRLLTNANVKEYIQERNNKLNKSRVATMEEVQEFWLRVLNGEEEEATIKDKIKVSELIGKTKGAFIERREVNGNMKVNNPYKNLTEEQLLELINK